jgi:hypothetical protein
MDFSLANQNQIFNQSHNKNLGSVELLKEGSKNVLVTPEISSVGLLTPVMRGLDKVHSKLSANRVTSMEV